MSCVICLDSCCELLAICCGQQWWHLACLSPLVIEGIFKCPLCRKQTALPKVYFAGKMTGAPCIPRGCEDADIFDAKIWRLTAPMTIRIGPWQWRGDSKHKLVELDTVEASFSMMDRADYVIAKPTRDSYGTLLEIGYAYRKGKTVFIDDTDLTEEDAKELWFALEVSVKSIRRLAADGPGVAQYLTHQHLLPKPGRALQLHLQRNFTSTDWYAGGGHMACGSCAKKKFCHAIDNSGDI
jgi:hypothetical protein